jgi:hypothetical protein
MDPVRPRDLAVVSPTSRCIGEFVALVVLMYGVLELCTEVFGVHDNVSLVAIVLACVSNPAGHLLEANRLSSPIVRNRSGIAMMTAVAPWVVIAILRQLFPDWAGWRPVDVPALSRYVGTATAIGLVAARPMVGGESAAAIARVPTLTIQNELLMISILLLSWSPVVAGITVYWLAALVIQRPVARRDNTARRVVSAFESEEYPVQVRVPPLADPV